MRKAFNKELLSIAKRDPRVFMILADIGYGEIEEFAETFPDRFINCGVAEQNMQLPDTALFGADSQRRLLP